MNINIDTSNIDLVHNPDILALVLKSLPKAHIVHVDFSTVILTNSSQRFAIPSSAPTKLLGS